MIKRFFQIGIVLILCSSMAFSQVKKPRAYVLLEFESIEKSSLPRLVDAFLAVVKNTEGSQGYVINYGSAATIKSRKNLLMNSNRWSCGYGGCRITFVDGPKTHKTRTVFWIIPDGGDLPKI